jgi:hypothetical protein
MSRVIRPLVAGLLLAGALLAQAPAASAQSSCGFHEHYVDFYIDRADDARARGDSAAYQWYLTQAVHQMAEYYNSGC